jgi:hypothetical protein
LQAKGVAVFDQSFEPGCCVVVVVGVLLLLIIRSFGDAVP